MNAETVSMKEKLAVVDDVLVQIAHDVSNMSAEEAIKAVPSLMDDIDSNYFRLGGVLASINANKHYEKEGYENFKKFVEERYAIPYRKAMYWISIYEELVESGVPWEKVKNVGWTKLKDLAPILNMENVDEWVLRAENSTVLQLQEAIKKATSGSLETSGITPDDAAKSEVTTVTFKVHADQKPVITDAIEKAKKEANTESPGVALEAICMNYMTGGKSAASIPLNKLLAKYSPEDVILAIENVFPNLEITVSQKKS